MNRTPAKQTGGKWAQNAFPPEAAMNFDEFSPEQVRELKAEIENELGEETWEVVDGLKFPYEKFA
ncbi:hypothetical protein JQX09_18200 [Sulfitobacter pseudonitzschiae]|uniref:Uncharacterized protein n=1 Tax=Pseudosulfitobacter pseudonitzschiae TaxID=1402135 RepID=A0A9Q2NT52_9RHOB|nr:hypothetical protein [Pseudosulfitobacter pseudonitzschiae]MBM1814539.1 hypothetical protein [Pseudosulfitobacter pseudonitzschiae]MBM1831533.1 hypothetical protein [Pseudosulfitobacter pseudonitzschiae]MBM1836399.1 hypothetical protein [Pseudosulfitobacter pseudonitzschiae]MBM1841245.1 hypothetical protein [Pseudosulfitobacter pseudonitzschiae]MBM1846113.1 hypothetical protein [Pseudosulfitobacter pseudonitzschiae]